MPGATYCYGGGERIESLQACHPMVMRMGDGSALQVFGALVLRLQRLSIVLRSPLRCSPAASAAPTHALGTDPTISLCSHEEAAWLKQAIGVRWLPVPIENFPIALVEVCASSLSLVSTNNLSMGFSYRHDLDGCWVRLDDGNLAVNVIRLESVEGPFGWLLPESCYPVNYLGRNWPTLAALWRCAVKNAADPCELYRQLYIQRLVQHANLLRRFRELKYPVRCARQLWLTRQLQAIRSEGINRWL